MASQLTEPPDRGVAQTVIEDPAGGLTFEWKEGRRKQRARIVFFFVLAVAMHAGFFYVFKVVYPVSTESLPMPSRVLLLSDDDPAVRALLAEVEDRTAAYSPSLGSDVGNVSLSAYTTYQPSFAEHELKLLDPPVNVAKRLPLPGTLDGPLLLPEPESIPLPDLPKVKPKPPGPQRPVLAIGGELAQRRLKYRPELDNIFSPSSDAVATFALAVDEAGIVEYCLPDDDLGDRSEALRRAASQADLKALGKELFKLRFETAPGEGAQLTWGTVTVEW